ncbi:unnamed protein product [Cunninghamella echinulata]
MTTPSTTLPFIQFLLTEQNNEDKKYTRGHRSTHSVSSLPSELQNLSLNGPSHELLSKDDTNILKPRPSWMIGPSATTPPPIPTSSSTSTSSSSITPPPSIVFPSSNHLTSPSLTTSRRPQGAHHQRSVSDFTLTPPLPPLTSSSSTSTNSTSMINIHSNNNNSNNNNNNAIPSYHSLNHHSHHQHHQHHHHNNNSINQFHTTNQNNDNINNNNNNINSSSHQIHIPSPVPPPLLHSTTTSHQRARQFSHRRAVSATTADHMILPHNSTNTPPPLPPLPSFHRSHSNSPPEEYLSLNTTKTQPYNAFIDQSSNKLDTIMNKMNTSNNNNNNNSMDNMDNDRINNNNNNGMNQNNNHNGNNEHNKMNHFATTHTTVNGMELPRDMATGRYLCPYCQKAFSRPSSLRIHTYSHTGEKPFVCTEDGCGRRFSVQSNMRRHLRVHRLSRKSPLKHEA